MLKVAAAIDPSTAYGVRPLNISYMMTPFLNYYDAQDPRVDFNQDGLVDFGDYLEFLNHYDAGC